MYNRRFKQTQLGAQTGKCKAIKLTIYHASSASTQVGTPHFNYLLSLAMEQLIHNCLLCAMSEST